VSGKHNVLLKTCNTFIKSGRWGGSSKRVVVVPCLCILYFSHKNLFGYLSGWSDL